MTDALSAAFRRPFNEQVSAFRLRLLDLVPTAAWDDIRRNAHDRAFMVAGAAKADLLADLADAVDRAVAEGTGLDRFKADFRDIVEKHGWHGWTGEGTAAGEAWRMRTIYRTNMATSYAAGRFAQLREAGFKYWIYRHGGSEHPRLHHLSWDGLILPADHEFWYTHYPPNGWGCSCYVLGAHSRKLAERRGDPSKTLPENWRDLDPKTGAPIGVGKLWDYAPGSTVHETVSQLAPKLANLPAPLGADLVDSWTDRIFKAWADRFAEFVTDALAMPPKGHRMIVGALLPRWIEAAKARGITPATADIAVTDKMVRHTFRMAKDHQLPQEWYRNLPLHLRDPSRVLLDETHSEGPAFLLYFDLPGTAAKLVVRVNFDLKKKRGVYNVVRTGSVADDSDIAERIGSGAIVIDGNGV